MTEKKTQTFRVVLTSGKTEKLVLPEALKAKVETNGALVFLSLASPAPRVAFAPGSWSHFETVEE